MSEHTVTTTINPGEVLVVGDAEYLDLQRYGLIAEAARVPEGEAHARVANPARRTAKA